MFDREEIQRELLPYKGKSEFRWLPLMTIDESTKNLLGVSDSAMWVCGKGSSLYEVSDPRSGFLLTPVLREDLASFVEKLKRSVLLKGAPESLLITFPFDSIVCAGILGDAKAVNDAYNWIAQGYPVSDTVAECFAKRNLKAPPPTEQDDNERTKYILSLCS